MADYIAFILLGVGVALMIVGLTEVFLPSYRGITTSTVTKAEFERVKREAERRFKEEHD